MFGVDISAHQNSNCVPSLNRKAEFIIIRDGFGTYSKDKLFDTHIQNAIAKGLKIGIYHASYAANIAEAQEEAAFLCKVISPHRDYITMPIFFDFEYFSSDYIAKKGITTTPKLVQDLTTAFCDVIRLNGYHAGFYTNLDFINRFYTQSYIDNHPEYVFWYARPGLAYPDKDCDLWQYASDNGLADYGYNGNIDKNVNYMVDVTEEIEPMKPLFDGLCRMKIGFASGGDIAKLTTKINGLGIETSTADGYIITGEASTGDQCYIIIDCNALGVPYDIYTEPQPEELPKNSNEKEEIDKLPEIENKPENGENLGDNQQVTSKLPANETDNTESEGGLDSVAEGENVSKKESLFIRILKAIFKIFFGGGD